MTPTSSSLCSTTGSAWHRATLRGLVDRWDAAGRPVVEPLALAAPTAAYDPDSYWERLHHRGDLSTVGQSGMSPELNAWLYRALEANLRRFLRRHAIDHSLPQVVFDVGTGIGYWVRFWRSMGVARVDGCDLVPKAVDAAGRAAREVGAEGDYIVANLATPDAFRAGRTGSSAASTCCSTSSTTMRSLSP